MMLEHLRHDAGHNLEPMHPTHSVLEHPPLSSFATRHPGLRERDMSNRNIHLLPLRHAWSTVMHPQAAQDLLACLRNASAIERQDQTAPIPIVVLPRSRPSLRDEIMHAQRARKIRHRLRSSGC